MGAVAVAVVDGGVVVVVVVVAAAAAAAAAAVFNTVGLGLELRFVREIRRQTCSAAEQLGKTSDLSGKLTQTLQAISPKVLTPMPCFASELGKSAGEKWPQSLLY